MAKAKPQYEIPAGRLWPNMPSGAAMDIEVFGATGEYESGKTLLGLTLAPGNHPEGHPFAGKPRTLLLDFEKSAGTYAGTGCHRIDVPVKMLELYKEKRYHPIDVFTWFDDLVTSKIKPGQFEVIMADPITDVEAGQVAYIRKHCDKYGLTSAQVSKAGGLLWGAVKDDWKQRLLKLGAKCQCFFFTSHLRAVWAGDKPSPGKREPKGKETLMELASLYLWLERSADDKGNVSNEPAAKVLKSRLADTLLDDDGKLQITPSLPPRLKVATVDAIRQYIANPPDYDRLKVGERVVAEEFSEEEAARVALATAEAQQATETSRLDILTRRQELQAMNRQAEAAKPQAIDTTAQQHTDKAAKVKADAEAADAKVAEAAKEADAKVAETKAEGERLMAGNDGEPNADAKCSDDQYQRIVKLCGTVKVTMKWLRSNILLKAGVDRIRDLSHDGADKVIAALVREIETRKK